MKRITFIVCLFLIASVSATEISVSDLALANLATKYCRNIGLGINLLAQRCGISEQFSESVS
jgi:hypothetical protein